MNTYQDFLVQLISILESAGERTWKTWLVADLKAWDGSRSIQHHLKAYRGMGSFTDFSLSSEVGHSVSKEVEPWINALFDRLSSLTYVYAKHISRHGKEPNEKVVKRLIQREVGGTLPALLAGWRCKTCKYTETADRKIILGAADYYVSHRISAHILKGTLNNLVQCCQHPECPETQSIALAIRNVVAQEGICIVNRIGWMRPCPKCCSQKTEVCQWRIDLDQGSVQLFQETLVQKLLKPRWSAAK